MSALAVPQLSLVCLVGASGSGKSTFARTHFGRFETVSSDFCRGLVADDENDQGATADAFEVLHFIVGRRLRSGRLTVVDATKAQPDARRGLVALAREHDVLPVAVVLDLPERALLLRPGVPPRPGRRPAGRRARRAQAGLPRASLGTRPQLRPVRRHHRRDGRVRAARALPVGRRLPRSRDGAVRPHADPARSG